MNRRILKAASAALAAMLLLTACGGNGGASSPAADGSSTTGTAASGGEKIVTIAQTSDWDTFMPMNTTNAGADNVIELVFDRLMIINTDGTFAPRLASSWEVNETSDKITYRLNENAKWHDGQPVTAQDVVFSAQVASSSEFTYPRRIRMQYFGGTDESGMELAPNSIEVKAVDEHTVEFTLKTPMDPSIVYALVNRDFFIIPQHLLKDIPDDQLATADFWQKPVGSGPCVFESTISGERIEFNANKDYYLATPDFDRLVYRKVTPANILAGLMSGEIDALGGNTSIAMQDWEAAKTQENLTTVSIPTFSYQYMAMNTSREYLPQEVRQAMSMAINRDVIIDQLMMGEGRKAYGPLPEDHPYYNAALPPIEYNPEKAAEMLKAAGWDQNRELEMLATSGSEMSEKTAILIQQDLQKVGIKTRIQLLDFPTLLNSAREGKYDLVFIGSAGSVDPSESVPNVTVGYMNNFAQLSDPTLGETGAAGALEITFEARKVYYDKYQELLREQMPMTFLYFKNNLFAHNNRISNIPALTTDYNINKCVEQWKVA